VADFRSEQVADIILECMADFIGIRTSPVRHSAINPELRSVARIIPPILSCENAHFTISKSALWTRLQSAYAHCFFQGRPQSLLSIPWVL